MQQNNFMQLTGVDMLVPVDGMEGAKAYPLGPSCRAPLFDKDKDIFYIKTTDANGFPAIRKFEFKEVVEVEQSSNSIALDDIRSLIREELYSVKEELLNGQQSVSATNSKQADRDESGDTTVIKHNGKPGISTYTKPKQSGSNSSVVEHGKDKQQSSANV